MVPVPGRRGKPAKPLHRWNFRGKVGSCETARFAVVGAGGWHESQAQGHG